MNVLESDGCCCAHSLLTIWSPSALIWLDYCCSQKPATAQEQEREVWVTLWVYSMVAYMLAFEFQASDEAFQMVLMKLPWRSGR